MALPNHPDWPQAETIRLCSFDDTASFGDFFRLYRHRCLSFDPDFFPFDISRDPPSHQKPNGEYESGTTRDVTPERRYSLSGLVGKCIQFTRNKELVRPAIRELCQTARDSPLPLSVISYINNTIPSMSAVPYHDEQGQSAAFQGEVFWLTNNIIRQLPQCLSQFERIAPYVWRQDMLASAGRSSVGAFGAPARQGMPPVTKLSLESKKQTVCKASPPGIRSLTESIIHLADAESRYPKSHIATKTSSLDKIIRQILDNVTTHQPVLYLFSTYISMLVLRVKPPNADTPYTTIEVGEEYLRYPTGDLYQPDGAFSNGTGMVSMATVLLATSIRRVKSPPWEWEKTYRWPNAGQVRAWMQSGQRHEGPASHDTAEDDEPKPEQRHSARNQRTDKFPSATSARLCGNEGSSPKASPRWDDQNDSQLHITTFFPYVMSPSSALQDFFLDHNTSFKAITQPNQPDLRICPASRLDRKEPTQLATRPNPGMASLPSLTFGERIGQGRLGVVFAGKLCLYGGNDVDVAIKLVTPKAFHSIKDGPLPVEDDYVELSSEDAEAAIRHEAHVYEAVKSLQGEVIPRCFGLWHGYCLDSDGIIVKELDTYMLLTELLSNGDGAGLDETAIIHAYSRLHDAGIVHGDVEKRHWKDGLILDLERAVLKPKAKPKATQQPRRFTVYEDQHLAAPQIPITAQRCSQLAKEERERVQCLLDGDSDA